MTKQQQAKAANLVILAIYRIKQDYTTKDGTFYKSGSVVYRVRNGQGKVYCSTLNKDKNHTCTCKAWTERQYRCYHVEVARTHANAAVASKQVAQQVDETIARVDAALAQPIVKQREHTFYLSAPERRDLHTYVGGANRGRVAILSAMAETRK